MLALTHFVGLRLLSPSDSNRMLPHRNNAQNSSLQRMKQFHPSEEKDGENASHHAIMCMPFAGSELGVCAILFSSPGLESKHNHRTLVNVVDGAI